MAGTLAQRFQETQASELRLRVGKMCDLYGGNVSAGEAVLCLNFVSNKRSAIQGVKIKMSNRIVGGGNQFWRIFHMGGL
jgi:hypothetical protein